MNRFLVALLGALVLFGVALSDLSARSITEGQCAGERQMICVAEG